MQDLRLIGVHEDGDHLLLTGPGGEHYTVALDDALRAAARRDRPRMGQLQIEIDGGMRPREVQSMIRAGATTEEVADRAGWSMDKVRRYEGAILAERVHMADQARQVRVRTRGGSAGSSAPTLQGRVGQRMRERGVDPDANAWDAWRGPEDRRWTVVLTFAAGGRQREASWVFDPVLRTVEASDDEARWLSADEPAPAGAAASSPPRAASVYDVEAEGGVAATVRRAAGGPEHPEEPLDLMTAMRQRTTVGRRSGRRRAGEARKADQEPALPLEPVGGADDADLTAPALEDLGRSGDIAAFEEPEVEVTLDEAPEVVEPVEAVEVDAPAAAAPEFVPREADAREADAREPDAAEADAHKADQAEADPASAELDRPAPKRKARTSVPSWDDIMFGAKRD